MVKQKSKKVKKQIKKKLSVEAIQQLCDDWATDWHDPLLQLKIIREIKEAASKTDYNIVELKSIVSKLSEKIQSGKKQAQKEKEEAEKKLSEEQQEKVEAVKPEQHIEYKDILKQEKALEEIENYKENEINWLDDPFYDNWDKVKGHCKNLWGHKKEYCEDDWKKFFLAHSKDTITGKPQLIEQVQKKIPLIRLVISHAKIKSNAVEKTLGLKINIDADIQSFYFFDEKFDGRKEGYQKDCFSLDFWIYRVITSEGKEYYLFTQSKMPNCSCIFSGMLVSLDDFAEMSRSMKLKSLSNIFFCKSFVPAIKVLSPVDIVNFTKTRKLTEIGWLNFLAYHKNGNYNRFPEDIELLKSAWTLSGKKDGYPLHWAILGPTGTKKSCGYAETTAYKFSEEPEICEGGNSRIKALSPSFKEKPCNIGFLAKAERAAFIDEIGKMIEFESTKSHNPINNVLGELNFLLEHKLRIVGSGNDNDVQVQATAKDMFVTNPCSNKPTIYSHVGLIDPTFMSRIMWWVQDLQEQEFALSEKAIELLPRTPKNVGITKKIEKNIPYIYMCSGECMLSRDEFITLFDSCYSFISSIDIAQIQRLANTTTQLAKEPMKGVWKPRAEHHITLLVDGLCKHRCLFKDYDNSFTAKQEDYDLAERILIRMVKGWDTDLSPKQEGYT